MNKLLVMEFQKTFTHRWCKDLISNLKHSSTDVNDSISDMKSTIINEMAEFKNTILGKMELVKNNAYEALTLEQTSLAASDANTTAITNLTSQFNDLKGECGKLRKENMALREQNNSFELYSRKKNLILHGITDTYHENNTTCISTVKTFFKCILKIDDMNVENCHRMQQRHNQVSRDIIVRFQSMTDKDAVWAAKTLLRNTSYGISEDFPKPIATHQRKLYPIFSQAKKKLPKGQASLKGDRLNIDGLIYTISTIDRLQGKLHHKEVR